MGRRCYGIHLQRMTKKKEPARLADRTGKKKGKMTMKKVYHKSAEMSREITEGCKDFVSLCALANEAAALYGIAAVMAGYSAPDWLPWSIGGGILTMAALASVWIWKAAKTSHIRRRYIRHGVITPDEICRILKKGAQV